MSELHPLDVVAIARTRTTSKSSAAARSRSWYGRATRSACSALTNGEPNRRGTPDSRLRGGGGGRSRCPVHQRLGLPGRELMDTPAHPRYTPWQHMRSKRSSSPRPGTPAASPDHYQGRLIIEASRKFLRSKPRKEVGRPLRWAVSPFAMPHRLMRWPFPFDAEQRHWPGSYHRHLGYVRNQMERSVVTNHRFDGERLERINHFITAPAFRWAAAAASPTANSSPCRCRSARRTWR